jgi:hypothetical protein
MAFFYYERVKSKKMLKKCFFAIKIYFQSRKLKKKRKEESITFFKFKKLKKFFFLWKGKSEINYTKKFMSETHYQQSLNFFLFFFIFFNFLFFF